MSGSAGGSRGFASPSTVSSGRGGSEGSWWRWTQGQARSGGSTSGSTSGSGSGSGSDGGGSARSGGRKASKSSPEPWDAVRWGKRPTRGAKEAAIGGPGTKTPLAFSPKTSGGSPNFFASSSQLRAASRSTMASRRKTALSPMHAQRGTAKAGDSSTSTSMTGFRSSRNGADATTKPAFPTVAQEERPFLASSSAKWTTGATKRKVTRNNKRMTRTPSPHARVASSNGLHDARGPRQEERKNAFVSVDDVVMMEDAEAFASKPTRPVATSVNSLGFGNPDPLVTCARAVLQDCLRQRCLESSNMRKRTLEGCSKCDAGKDAKYSAFSSKPYEFGSLSGCSSSSDDELSQLSSLEFALNGTDKTDCKANSEELYRQLMLCDYSLSTSPDFECFSPLFEEKGLPVEIRYQLPLALGTANETDKECTICQLRYGIGDHIVTLPCQHFFHACCVDKWLWNHTSCPLCRTEVSLDANPNQTASKHRFNECPQLDQETMRRKMRSSSHSVGFRPVIPAKSEVDQLDMHLTNLAIDEDEDDTETNSLTYLVCPKPQRSHPKQPH